MRGNLLYREGDGGGEDGVDNWTGCKELEVREVVDDFNEEAYLMHNGRVPSGFVMMDRSDYGLSCTFVQRSRNVAHSGGALAIIIDNRDELTENVIMSDDGTGAGIQIPSMLIGKTHGDILKDFWNEASDEDRNNIELVAGFEMDMERKPAVTLWYSSGDRKFVRFLADLSEYMVGILPHLEF